MVMAVSDPRLKSTRRRWPGALADAGLGLVTLHAAAAAWFWLDEPRAAPFVLFILLGGCLLLRRLWGRPALVAALLGFHAAWWFRDPPTWGPWHPLHEHALRVEVNGRSLRVEGVRHATSAQPPVVNWSTHFHNLDDLESLDLVLHHFGPRRGVAHAQLSFGFRGGERLAVSAEIRRRPGESFDPWKGLFRHYPLIYVAGDERDLIGARIASGDEVRLVPIRAERAQIESLLLAMLRKGHALGEEPEYYHTFFNNCLGNILRHVEGVNSRIRAFDVRAYLPGYADELARELDLLGSPETLILQAPPEGLDSADWSNALRLKARGQGAEAAASPAD